METRQRLLSLLQLQVARARSPLPLWPGTGQRSRLMRIVRLTLIMLIAWSYWSTV